MTDARDGAGSLRFAGYAAIFDRLDGGGDVVRPGAFDLTLKQGRTIPLLWQHRTNQVIGVIEHLKEDRRGLQVIGRLNDDAAGRQLARELKRGTLSGLSFGYRVTEAARQEHHRQINRVELMEISLVRRPMQPLARIHKVAA